MRFSRTVFQHQTESYKKGKEQHRRNFQELEEKVLVSFSTLLYFRRILGKLYSYLTSNLMNYDDKFDFAIASIMMIFFNKKNCSPKDFIRSYHCCSDNGDNFCEKNYIPNNHEN